MGVQFQWRKDGWDEADSKRSPGRRQFVWLIVVALAATAALLTSWQVNKRQARAAEQQRNAAVQTVLDLAHQAYLNGDGELFFALFEDIPTWRAAQLTPLLQRPYRSGATVTAAEQRGTELWTTIQWSDEEGTWERRLFFKQQARQLVQIPAPAGYLGLQTASDHSWGNLVMYSADAVFRQSVASNIEFVTREICAAGCQPLTVFVGTSLAVSAAPGQILIPSPAFVGLTPDGRAAPFYWELLRSRVLDSLGAPATIRFGVPGNLLYSYESLADEFSERFPHYRVELVAFDDLPDGDAALFAAVDGAATTPHNARDESHRSLLLTESLVASGLLLDLTQLAATDATYDLTDFYEQVWQGGWWNGRLWVAPHSAHMNVIFLDNKTYRAADREFPGMQWTWSELETEMRLVESLPADSFITWPLFDPDLDLLFAYAYSTGNECQAEVTIRCEQYLGQRQIAETLQWYAQISAEGQILGLANTTWAERRQIGRQSLSARREVLIWVEDPTIYEVQLQLDSMAVRGFPASERLISVAPLRVNGHVISQASSRPVATWTWISFLSHQAPAGWMRLIPARPSVAVDNQYWTRLPRPLADVMRTAFPLARPITLAEQTRFNWDQIDALAAGTHDPSEAATLGPPLRWFGK